MILLRQSKPEDHDRLFKVWQTAVEATHHFLKQKDAEEISAMVREQYIPNVTFTVTVDENDIPTAFLGMTDNVIDALFVHADHLGQGIGSVIMGHVKERFDHLKLDVNEDNSGARAFYEKQGFVMTGRSETDDDGRPYPIIHMEWVKR